MHIFFDAEKLAAHLPLCDKMNIRQTLERYVPDPPKAKSRFSSKFSPKKRSRSRSLDKSSEEQRIPARGSGREFPILRKVDKENHPINPRVARVRGDRNPSDGLSILVERKENISDNLNHSQAAKNSLEMIKSSVPPQSPRSSDTLTVPILNYVENKSEATSKM